MREDDEPVSKSKALEAYARIVEQYAPPSLLLTREHEVVHASENAGRFLQAPPGEATSDVFKLLREPLRVELRAAIHLAREHGKPARSRPVTLSIEGEMRRVVLQVRPANSAEHSGFLLVVFDELEESIAGADGPIEEAAGMEQRVTDRTSELRERERRLGALAVELSLAERRERLRLAHVLHDDAQQALIAAQMRLNLIESDLLDQSARKDLDESIELLKQCQQTLRTLAGELAPPALEERGLTAALEWLAKRMREQHRLEVRVDADPQADAIAPLVRDQIFQIVRELLLNVVKHAKTDRAQLLLARADDKVVLEVRDQGCGFDPVAAERAKGDSFGLFHARERLRHLGGDLEISSVEGVGSRAIVRVPASPEVPIADRAPETDVGAAALPPIATGDVVRVLLAEDHPTVRRGLARLLERETRIRIVGEAGDGAEILNAVRRFQPQVVVMDINMPEVNGIEATRRLTAAFPDLRVIGLSLHDESDMAEAILEAGAESYFSKGGPSADLIAAILAPAE